MTLPMTEDYTALVERLVERVERWNLNRDTARISVPLGELRAVLAWNPELMDPQKVSDLLIDCRAYLSALPQEPPSASMGVVVKALEWSEDRDDDGTEIHRAHREPVNLPYTVYEDGFIKKPFGLSLNQLRIASFDSVEAAKAAAQADYERRILSCLAAPVPATNTARPLSSGARHPLEAYADSYAEMSRMGDGQVACRSVEVDIRQNMIPVTQAVPTLNSGEVGAPDDHPDVIAFDAAVAAGRARIATRKPLDDDQIMEIIKEVAPWKDEPKLNDLLTYEKSPPLFPQATYDVPSYRAVRFVRAVEARLAALSAPSTPEGWRDMASAPKDATILIAVERTNGKPMLKDEMRAVYPAYVDEDGNLCDPSTWKAESGYSGEHFRTVGWMPLPSASAGGSA